MMPMFPGMPSVGGLFLGLAALLLVIIAVVVVVLASGAGRPAGGSGELRGRDPGGPEEELRRRYARGEIDTEEYRRRLAVLSEGSGVRS
jgi:putative membrane protein